MNAPQGAGIQAAQNVADKGVRRLVTGHCGPKAFRVLNEADIEVYNTELPTVAAALEALEAGRLKPLNGPDVEGHWS
jgi:predicted Fe-Mo cluster-binding NifX family protein